VDDDEQHRRRDDDSMPVVLHRLTALERRVEDGFSHIDQRLDALGFVRADVYAAERRATTDQLTAMKRDIDDARRPGIWALSVLGAAFLVALVGFLVQIATQGAA